MYQEYRPEHIFSFIPEWEQIFVHNFNCPLMQKTSFIPLLSEFYIRTDVVQVARDLLGKILYTSFNHEITAGIIIRHLS